MQRATQIPFTNLVSLRWKLLLLSSIAPLTFLLAQPPSPRFEQFQVVVPTRSYTAVQTQLPGAANPILRNDPYRDQNLKAMQQAGMTLPGMPDSKQQQIEQFQQEWRESQQYQEQNAVANLSNPFYNNLQQFLQLNPDSFSVTKAIYLSESAYYDNRTGPTYQQFQSEVKLVAKIVKQILKREGLSETNSMAVNYAIQKLYSQSNQYYDSITNRTVTIPKLRYDFDDFMGDKDWKKMFVSKLLQTGTGQCHNLPLLYLCIAEQLQAKVYLSLAPNHSFVQYFDQKGNRYNYETTNGNLVSQAWLASSTFVNSVAMKKGTYLDTLSSKKLYAQCLGDLLFAYLEKFRHYDDFSEQISKKILAIDSTNLTALMERTNRSAVEFDNLLKAYNHPSKDQYKKNPDLDNAFKALQLNIQKVQNTGFQEMPKEQYKEWLKSLESEKQKQRNQLEQEKMEREIKNLKNLKSTLITDPKQ